MCGILLLILGCLNLIGQELPADYSIDTIATGFETIQTIQFTKDGRIFVTEQGGKIKIILNGHILPAPALDLGKSIRGFTLSPKFDSDHYVFIFYDSLVSRFTERNNTIDAASEFPVYSFHYPVNTFLSFIGFGSNNKLFIAVTSHNNPGWNQTPYQRTGRVLRINPDGTIPDDNPFPISSKIKNANWSFGLSNMRLYHIGTLGNILIFQDSDNGEKAGIVDNVSGGRQNFTCCTEPLSFDEN